MPNGFSEDKNTFFSPNSKIQFEMMQQGKDFYQTAKYKGPQGEQKSTTRIDLVLGAGGTADDVFLSWHDDGTMRELPMVWLYPSQCWSTSHFDPNSGGDFSRPLTIRCFECHNTWAVHVPGTLNQYSRDGRILGVTCESCHGPAANHVDFHQTNPTSKIGTHIVRPSRLERERQIEVCTQCHSNAMKHLGPAFQFRPGYTLANHYKTIETSATEDDRVANQITYLRKSKCFQKSEMACATCHNPHQPSSPSNSGSSNCAKCHQPTHCTDAMNIPAGVRGECVSCHMPSYLKINVNFETESNNYVPPIRRYEHRIAIHNHARDETLLHYYRQRSDGESRAKVHELTEHLVEHFQKEADQAQKEYRYLAVVAALREMVRFKDTPENRKVLQQAVEFQTNLDKYSTTAQRQLL
ncbi:MAG TPA: multiheme c-type cytochrome, partial [Pirellula sp.]|nr:multiheme c-type cytochrome [Pirellula sp.]